jgi:anti-sigma factor RsiW
MSGMHPSEETLQQYALDHADCGREEIDHIGNCAHCQALIAIYGVVIAELDRQAPPVFDFDLTATVMRRVQTTRVQQRPQTAPAQEQRSNITAIRTVIALVIGIPAWLFRKSAYFVFTDMSPAFYGLLLAAAGVVIGLFIFRLQRKYQDVINLINK